MEIETPERILVTAVRSTCQSQGRADVVPGQDRVAHSCTGLARGPRQGIGYARPVSPQARAGSTETRGNYPFNLLMYDN